MSDSALLTEIRDAQAVITMAHARLLAVIAEADTRGVVVDGMFLETAAVVKDMLRLSASDAKRLVVQANAVVPGRTPTGQDLPPALPVLGKAVAAGQVMPAQVDAIVQVFATLPDTLDEPGRERLEEILVDAAESADPVKLRRLGRRTAYLLDQDGREPTVRDLMEGGENTLDLRVLSDGSAHFRGTLAPEPAALLRAMIDAGAKPTSTPDQQGDATNPAGLDVRSVFQRQGDALAEILRAAADSGVTPIQGGQKPHLIVTIPLAHLESGLGEATLDGGVPITAAQARVLACDAKVIPVVLGGNSEPLDIGRSSRSHTAAMQRALIIRDKGCAFPGCDRPPRYCQAHHVKEWVKHQGHTALHNLVNLCARHHRVIHHTPWEVEIRDGQAWFIPPGYVDPTRTPQRNTLHDPIRYEPPEQQAA